MTVATTVADTSAAVPPDGESGTPITIPKAKRTRMQAAAQQILALDPGAASLLTEICAPLDSFGLTRDSFESDEALKPVKLPKAAASGLLAQLETLVVELDALQDVEDDAAWGNPPRATPASLSVPRRSIRSVAAPDNPAGFRYEIALDGVAEADSFATAHHARMEVDMLGFTRSIGLELRSTTLNFSDETLGLAHELAYAFFRTRAVRQSLDKALELLVESDRRWSLDRDGQTILVMPSTGATSYKVTDTCTCEDVWRRQPQHNGMCKHLALRVLLVLSQLGVGQLKHLKAAVADAETRFISAEAVEAPSPASEAMAFIEIPAMVLLAAGGFARLLAGDDQLVRLVISGSTLTLVVGDHCSTVQGKDGDGQAMLALSAERFRQFWQRFRPQAPSLGLLRVFIDSGSLNLFDDAGSFQFAVPAA